MDLEASSQSQVLIALAIFAGAVAALVLYGLKSKAFHHLDPHRDRVRLIVLVLFFSALGALTTFLLFNALASGDAYGIGRRDRGEVRPVSQDPAYYWILVAFYSAFAVPALSCAFVFAVRLIRAARSDTAVGSSRARALAAESRSPAKSFQRRAVVAMGVYFIGLAAFYVYSAGKGTLSQFLPITVFAPFFVLFALHALATGRVHVSSGMPHRSKNPIAYWSSVAILLAMGIGLFLVGIGVFDS